jgi:hypothetical protein
MSDKYPGGFVTANAPAGFSVAFDGTGDYLTVPASSNFAPGTGDFTVDAWLYPTSSTIQRFFAQTTSGTNYFIIDADVPNKIVKFIATSSGGGTAINSAATLGLNQWNYICVSRTSGTVTVWCNGSAGTPTVNNTDLNNTTYVPTISGYTHSTSNEPIIGYLAGLRYIKGTALSGAVAPTVAFPVTNTQLLTCQSPTIIDLSINALTVTVNGDAKVSNFTPFAAYQGFNPALGAAAGGVWTIDEAAYYQQNRLWPIYDPYFNQTTLMLHGNSTGTVDSTGTPVYQNNTFLDSSNNNFPITRNGNTTQGSFSPFSQTGWSVSNTINQYCQLNNADYSFSTGDFTVELWMYCVDDSTYAATNICSAPSNPNFTVGFGSGSAGARQLYVEYGGGATTGIGSSMSGYLNKWTHIAVVRQSGIVTAYQNGVSLGSVSKAAAVGSTANLYLLRNTGDTGQDFRGYVSNLRISKSAVYTSNFTPSTAPFAPVSNTVLLTFQSNRFVDNSALRATVTPTSTSIQAFSPFVPAYITPTTYSNWFDGTGDYLSSSSANYTATGDFTIEAWFYATSNPSFGGIVSTRNSTGPNGVNINLDSSQKIRFFINNNDFPAGYVSYNLNQWYHVALVRSGSGSNNVTAYVNGISVGSVTNTASTVTSDLVLGRFYTELDNYYLNGVISNARFVNGTAIYTANFTPPNAPFPTGTTNQQLLTCQASTMIDSNTYTTAKTITANGNVRPVTSPTPFPAKVDTTTLNSAYSTSLIGGSGYFDGTGDYLSATGNSSTQMGTGAFTWECWCYITSVPSYQCFIDTRTNPTSGSSTGMGFILNTGTYTPIAATTGTILTSSINVQANAWNHVALTRTAGGTLTIWVNGVSGGTVSNSTNMTDTALFVGGNSSSGYPAYVNGYLSNTRITKGSDLYTATFTPPTAPLTTTVSGGTVGLLLNYTNGAIFDNTAKNVLETVGNAQISTTQSKWGGSSMYFDGNGDYLFINSSANNIMSLGTGDFTVETWVNFSNISNSPCICSGFVDASNGWYFQYYSNNIEFALGGTAIISRAATVSNGTWYHMAVTRSGGTLRAFLDGVQQGATVTGNTSNLNVTNGFYVGILNSSFAPTTRTFAGYLDDLRITRGVARYTTNFTPPTSQLQDQ